MYTISFNFKQNNRNFVENNYSVKNCVNFVTDFLIEGVNNHDLGEINLQICYNFMTPRPGRDTKFHLQNSSYYTIVFSQTETSSFWEIIAGYMLS